MLELKNKPLDIILRACSVLLALTALFLITISVIFTFGGDAPNIFGKNIYIVKTDAFDLIKSGDAVLTSEVSFGEILPGNIVIYQNSEKQCGIAEIQTAGITDGVYGFTALSERGVEIKLSQSQIIGKAMQFSGFLGGLITFAKSPSGVLIAAVLPCLAVLIVEAVKALTAYFNKGKDVSPVKKQDEVPTFVPRQKVLPQKFGGGQEPILKVNAAINSYKDNEPVENDFTKTAEEKEYPLFTPPKSGRINSDRYKPPQNTNIHKNEKPYPVSQKRLNEVIAETNASRGTNKAADSTAELTDIKRTAIGNTASLSETVRRYIPKKTPPAQNAATATLPRLDQLLNDDENNDSENIRYDIADILSSLEKK